MLMAARWARSSVSLSLSVSRSEGIQSRMDATFELTLLSIDDGDTATILEPVVSAVVDTIGGVAFDGGSSIGSSWREEGRFTIRFAVLLPNPEVGVG